MKNILICLLLILGGCRSQSYITVSQTSNKACMLGDVVAIKPVVIKNGQTTMVIRCNNKKINVLIVGFGGFGPYPETKINLKTVKYVKDLLYKKIEVCGVVENYKDVQINNDILFIAESIEEY